MITLIHLYHHWMNMAQNLSVVTGQQWWSGSAELKFLYCMSSILWHMCTYMLNIYIPIRFSYWIIKWTIFKEKMFSWGAMWQISGGRISFKVTDNSRWGEANEKTFIQINVAQFYIETPSDYSLLWVVFSLRRSNTYNKKIIRSLNQSANSVCRL